MRTAVRVPGHEAAVSNQEEPVALTPPSDRLFFLAREQILDLLGLWLGLRPRGPPSFVCARAPAGPALAHRRATMALWSGRFCWRRRAGTAPGSSAPSTRSDRKSPRLNS